MSQNKVCFNIIARFPSQTCHLFVLVENFLNSYTEIPFKVANTKSPQVGQKLQKFGRQFVFERRMFLISLIIYMRNTFLWLSVDCETPDIQLEVTSNRGQILVLAYRYHKAPKNIKKICHNQPNFKMNSKI